METYLTEEERLEALQRWWKHNRSSLAAGVIVGLLIVMGWKYWQAHQEAQREAASFVYHQVGQAITSKHPAEAIKAAEQLIGSYPDTTYAEFSRITLARLKVEAGDLDAAKLRLEEELKQGRDETLKDLARLRLARVLLSQGSIDAGLALFADSAKLQGQFSALYEEVRGDLLVQAKRLDEARQAYLKSKDQGNRSPLLDLKLHDLPVAG